MNLNHLTPSDIFLTEIVKCLNRNIDLKVEILEKINNSYGLEKMSWIKKYNGLFIEPYKF
jgi:hypothetical protein